ncbi:response regulator transcription factor [Paenibacillus thalictri]|uniref:Response regulator n=1 Tax=Paenibacillus thalictri TaxID=2527873 RepID=A0A4Q9DMG0_9BACL|nr:response regulator [Paenibacillus thalictri]TBL73890.1 response regulator [Paenibacillus thalictri]
MNILVVDDEYIVCKGIETIILRSGHDWNVVGKAGNGLEALRLMEKEPVDLIVTDIRMPEMNGLELIERLFQEGYSGEVMILSSYADFEYARKAVQCGAVNYLLKPVDPDELINTIQQAEQSISERNLRHSEREQLTKNKQLMSKMLLTQLLLGYETNETKIRRGLEQAGIPLKELVVITAGRPEQLSSECWERCKLQLLAAIRSGCGCMAEDVSFVERYLVLAAWSGETPHRLASAVSCLERWAGSQTESPHVRMGLSDVCRSMSDIPLLLAQSICSQNEAAKTSRSVVQFGDAAMNDAVIHDPTLPEQKLLQALKSGYADEVRLLTQELALYSEPAQQASKLKGRKIIEQVKQLVFKRYASDIQIRDIADEIYMNASYLSDLFKQTTGMTFTDFVIEYRLQVAKSLLLDDPQLKLYQVADKVGYKNPKHFSQIFKKHVGMLPAEFREIR